MYYIIVYDVNERRIRKVHNILKKYLYWRQRSVFEGELSNSQFRQLMRKLNELINETEDSVIIYEVQYKGLVKVHYLGDSQQEDDFVI